MNLTKYHAKYFAYELTRQMPSNGIGKLTSSLQDAQVDLNPFNQDNIVICSFQFAKAKASYLEHTAWDLVIIDDYVFGDLKSFKSQYSHQLDAEDYTDIEKRLNHKIEQKELFTLRWKIV